MDTCLFLYKYLLLCVHVLLMHMLHGHLLIVVRTFAFGAYALWILAYFYTSAYCRPYICFWSICFMDTCLFLHKYLLSFIHMLLVHVFHGHSLVGTNAFCRPCTCFSYTCFMGTCFLVQVLFVACIFHCPFRGLHELIMLVFLVVWAWRVLRFFTSEFFEAVMWTMVPSFTRRKRNFVWKIAMLFWGVIIPLSASSNINTCKTLVKHGF